MSANKVNDLKYAKLVAKAWADEDFKERLLADPMRILAEFDMEFPEGKELRVVEDSDEVMHFVIPKRPESATFSEKSFSGGEHGCRGCGGCFGCRGCGGGD